MKLVDLVSKIVFPQPSELVGESFGMALGASSSPLRCHALATSETAARDYLELIGRPNTPVIVHAERVDLNWLEGTNDDAGTDIVVFPATMPTLNEEFFRHPNFRFFVDHLYVPERRHESPMLYTVGTTTQGHRNLAGAGGAKMSQEHCAGERRRKLNQLFGSTFMTDMQIVDALRGPGVRGVRLHGLGPDGTNIARCCRLFVAAHGLEAKTDIVIHPRKIEPLEYAEMAAQEVTNGIVPLHVECAVFYALNELYQARRNELVFASHYYMPLDSMQLASRPDWDPEGTSRTQLRVACHPSPKSLAGPLFECGASYLRASSNSDAAVMVSRGEADVAITTGSARQEHGLATLHDFGCPTMLFTIGASVSAAVLMRYSLESALLQGRGSPFVSSARV